MLQNANDANAAMYAARLVSATLSRRNFTVRSKVASFCSGDRSLVNELNFIAKSSGGILGVPGSFEV